MDDQVLNDWMVMVMNVAIASQFYHSVILHTQFVRVRVLTVVISEIDENAQFFILRS